MLSRLQNINIYHKIKRVITKRQLSKIMAVVFVGKFKITFIMSLSCFKLMKYGAFSKQ